VKSSEPATIVEQAARPLSAAVIGTGFIGEIHSRSVRAAGGRLTAVAASTPERSKEAAQRLGAERIVGSPEELAAADDIDVVHVCTPNRFHADYVRAALESGKHVICEKPLATDPGTAAELTELAASKGLTATVPFVYRFYPTVRHARDRVARGDLGAIRLLHGTYLQDWMSEPQDWSWRVDPELNGPSRAFADIGSHWCDLVEFISGHRITSVMARLRTALEERFVAENAAAFSSGDGQGQTHRVTTEDLGILVFETDGGATGSAVISQISPGRKNRLWLELDGEAAALVFDQEHPEELWLGRRDAATVVPRGSMLMSEDTARFDVVPAGHPQGYRDCFDAFVADTYAAIRGESPDGLPTFEDGARSAVIVAAVVESSRTERWVEVPS
jgi:predicted dehydrogenase